MTPEKLIKRAFKSEFPISRALTLLQLEAIHDPHMEKMIKAVDTVYWRHTYPHKNGSYASFIRNVERRKT